MLACLNTWEAPKNAVPTAELSVYGRQTLGRAEVEAFVQSVYAEHYGATIREFAPVLLALRDAQGVLVAAVGYRCAALGPLFLERYLDAPVEQLLLGPQTPGDARSGMVEVAHLAALRPGEGRRMMAELGRHLAQQGTHWVISTVTRELRHLFLRMGIAPLALGVADPERLGERALDWGTYYHHEPVVLAVVLAQTQRLRPRLVAGA
jgi:AcrR family transcriptional regulator